MEQYLNVGVPVYFVIKNVDDYSSIDMQNLICSTSGCAVDSVLNQISQASFQSNATNIAIPANSWLDDYFDWLSAADCCGIYSNDSSLFCPSSTPDQSACPVTYHANLSSRPVPEDFYDYLHFFMSY